MTKDELKAKYWEVCKKFGDLVFAKESLEYQLAGINAQLDTLRAERATLQKAHQADANPPSEATD